LKAIEREEMEAAKLSDLEEEKMRVTMDWMQVRIE
jgi:hypothetical protein